MITIANEDHIHSVKIDNHDQDKICWKWCRENLATSEWHMKFSIMGESCSYYFKNGEDATAFKLTFNIK